MSEVHECLGGPLDGEQRDGEPDGYSFCYVTMANGDSLPRFLWWPHRCACGRKIAKHMTVCGPCNGRPDE